MSSPGKKDEQEISPWREEEGKGREFLQRGRDWKRDTHLPRTGREERESFFAGGRGKKCDHSEERKYEKRENEGGSSKRTYSARNPRKERPVWKEKKCSSCMGRGKKKKGR